MQFNVNRALIIGLLIVAMYIPLKRCAEAAEPPKHPTAEQRSEYFQARASAVEAAANLQQFNLWAQGESEKRKTEAEKSSAALHAAFEKLPKPPAGKVYDERTLELKDAPQPKAAEPGKKE